MSFNIQHGFDFVRKDRIDLSLTADAIRKADADIIGLNEMRGEGPDADYTDQTKAIADMLGFHYYFAKAIEFNNKGPYGNAILSRYPIKQAETFIIPDPVIKDEPAYYETRCILKADFDVAAGFSVYVSHFGLAVSEKRNAVKTLIQLIDKQEKPYVFMGDLNMTPDNELLQPIYNRLIDTANVFNNTKLSFPSDQPRVKIDYIFTSKDIRVISADVPSIVVSDHRPHIAVLEIKELYRSGC